MGDARMMSRDDELQRLLDGVRNRAVDDEALYQQFVNAGLVNRVIVQAYRCRQRGRLMIEVVRVGTRTLARTTDYRLSTERNAATSVESARRKYTLDGDRHWFGHVYDVDALAEDGLGIPLNCQHVAGRAVAAQEILDLTREVTPGRPKKPILV